MVMPELAGHEVPDSLRSAARDFERSWASWPRRANRPRQVEYGVARDMALLSALHAMGLIEWVGDRAVDAT